MLKKILIIFILSLSFFSLNVNADEPSPFGDYKNEDGYNDEKFKTFTDDAKNDANYDKTNPDDTHNTGKDVENYYNGVEKDNEMLKGGTTGNTPEEKAASEAAASEIEKQEAAEKAIADGDATDGGEGEDSSKAAEGDITKIDFMINVDNISPGMKISDKGANIEQRVNYALGTIIQKMMFLLGSAALFVMTIGAGYIIIHHGQDELLSKGKAIFMSGVYALVIALSAYYIVSIFRYILFTGNT